MMPKTTKNLVPSESEKRFMKAWNARHETNISSQEVFLNILRHTKGGEIHREFLYFMAGWDAHSSYASTMDYAYTHPKNGW